MSGEVDEFYDELEACCMQIKNYRSKLNSEISRVDKEITDIQHYIEFCNLSASGGYKIAAMLKERLSKRREIKNTLERLNRISVMNTGFIANGKGRDALEKLTDKHYTPRILKELFEEV